MWFCISRRFFLWAFFIPLFNETFGTHWNNHKNNVTFTAVYYAFFWIYRQTFPRVQERIKRRNCKPAFIENIFLLRLTRHQSKHTHSSRLFDNTTDNSPAILKVNIRQAKTVPYRLKTNHISQRKPYNLLN